MRKTSTDFKNIHEKRMGFGFGICDKGGVGDNDSDDGGDGVSDSDDDINLNHSEYHDALCNVVANLGDGQGSA